MTIGSLYISPLGMLLMLVPFVLAFVAVWLRSTRPNVHTAGFVSNASRFAYWLFILTLLSIVITLIVGLFDSHLSFFSKGGLGTLVIAAILYFLCYYIIAFKPVDADQLEEAKEKGDVFFETAGLAATGVAGGVAGVASWTWKMLAQAPIDIIRRSGNTIWYRQADVGGFMGNIVGILIPLVIAAVIIVFAAMFYLLIVVVLAWFLVVYKFVRNLVDINGPRLS